MICGPEVGLENVSIEIWDVYMNEVARVTSFLSHEMVPTTRPSNDIDTLSLASFELLDETEDSVMVGIQPLLSATESASPKISAQRRSKRLYCICIFTFWF